MTKGSPHSIVYLEIADLKAAPRNARTHSKRQIEQIGVSMRRFGFTNPVLIDDDNGIIAGNGRVSLIEWHELHDALGLADKRHL